MIDAKWNDFFGDWEWDRGEHVTILGPTGSGKTHLMTAILPKHPDVVTFNLKPNDTTLLERLPESTWQRIAHWPPPQVYTDRPNWVVLKPKQRSMETNDAHQARVVRYCLKRIYEGPPGAQENEQGRWTIAVPDLFKLLKRLKVADKGQQPDDQLEQLYTEGRGIGVSLVIDAQTTAWLERLSLDQPMHFFMFRPRDRDRADRYAELGNRDKAEVRDILEGLDADNHEFLYVPTSGDMLVTKVD